MEFIFTTYLFSLLIGNDGIVYVAHGETRKTLLAINDDGTIKWGYSPLYSTLSLLIGNDGIVYVGHGETLLAINDDGTLIWSYTTEGIQALNYYLYNNWTPELKGAPAEMSPAFIDSFGIIYVGFAGTLLAINPDGTLNWSYTTESYLIYSPVIDSDGTVYIGSYDNNLYALQQ